MAIQGRISRAQNDEMRFGWVFPVQEYHKTQATLQRRLRLVVLLNRKDLAKPRFIVLGSTDPELNGHKLVALYAARFQIAFLFRDSKQFTGLLDCQARAASALDFHFNASLATLNLVRAEDLCRRQSQEPHVFSMASWKQCHFNERLLDVFMENLGDFRKRICLFRRLTLG